MKSIREHLVDPAEAPELEGAWARIRSRRSARPAWAPRVAVAVAVVVALVWWVRSPAPTAPRAAIDLSASVFTPEVVRLDDGTNIVVMPGARLVPLERTASAVGWRLERGAASFEVAHDRTRTFYVEGGDARVVVVGTRFAVRRDGAALAVEVDRGTVRVEAPTGTREVHGGNAWRVERAFSTAIARGDEAAEREDAERRAGRGGDEDGTITSGAGGGRVDAPGASGAGSNVGDRVDAPGASGASSNVGEDDRLDAPSARGADSTLDVRIDSRGEDRGDAVAGGGPSAGEGSGRADTLGLRSPARGGRADAKDSTTPTPGATAGRARAGDDSKARGAKSGAGSNANGAKAGDGSDVTDAEASDDPLAAADRDRARGAPRAAAARLEAFIAGAPDDARVPLALFMLARIHHGDLDDPGAAAPRLEAAIAAGLPRPLEERALARLVECYVATNQRALARAAARRYVDRFPNGARIEQIRRWAPKP